MCSIAHQLSMTMLSTDYHRLSAMSCLMNFQWPRKQQKQFSICRRPRPQVQTQYLQRSKTLEINLTELFYCILRKESISQEFKDAYIIHLYKRKGNPHVCDNHKGISLLSIAGKILAKPLLNHLNKHLDKAGTFTRKSVWIQEGQRNNTHDLHSKSIPREMS